MAGPSSQQRRDANTLRARTLGHLALYYTPGSEAPARRLFEDLGATLLSNGPAPGSDGFCSVLLDADTANHSDNLLYLASMSAEQWETEQRVRSAVMGTDAARPYLAKSTEWPESTPHFGIRFATLESLEAAVLAIESDLAADGPLAGRVQLTKFRARPGLDPGIDERIDASPIFSGQERPAFGDYLVQVFVASDLFGFLTSGRTLELDFTFPPYFSRVPSFG